MEFNISDSQIKWQSVAREFATKIITPEAIERDRIQLAKDRIPWDWIKLVDEAGIRTLGVPKNLAVLKSPFLLCVSLEKN